MNVDGPPYVLQKPQVSYGAPFQHTTPAVTYCGLSVHVAPAPVVEYISAVNAASAVEVESISPAPVVSCAAPVLVVEYICQLCVVCRGSTCGGVHLSCSSGKLRRASSCGIYFSSSCSVSHASSSREIHFSSSCSEHAPAPVEGDLSSAIASYAAPAQLQYVAPARWHSKCPPATSGRLCSARAVRSTSPQGGPVSYAPALKYTMAVTGVNMNRDGSQLSLLRSTVPPYKWSTSKLRGTGFSMTATGVIGSAPQGFAAPVQEGETQPSQPTLGIQA